MRATALLPIYTFLFACFPLIEASLFDALAPFRPALASLGGKIFSYGTPALGVMDSASDIWVAVDFYQDAKAKDESPTFFKISVGLLSLSSLAGALCLCVVLMMVFGDAFLR